MITAFQRSAFQNNAFQIGVEVSGGGGKWTPYAYGLMLARLEAEAKERERKEKETAEEAARIAADAVVALDAPIITEFPVVEAAARVTLDRLMPKPAVGPDLELEEFAEFMKLLAEFEEFA